ncbi:MAG: heat-inducible transcriptional repressor HrcA [Ktedonobacterales bacterium]
MTAERRLNQRKEAILRALVEEHVRTGEPVASKQLSDQLARAYGPGYASATVRNELATLEEDGLIYQPHISAGRVPTDLGYRYFVERLMVESQLSLDEQRLIGHQFYQVQHRLDEWVRLTASVLAQALQSAAIVTPPRGASANQARLKHFELLSLYETVALIVLVLEDGAVRQERVMLEEARNQDELSALAQWLNSRLKRATAQTLNALAQSSATSGATASADERLVLETLARLLTQADIFTPETFYHDGIVELLRRAEFAHADSERIRNVVEALERNSFLPAIAPQVMAAEGVQVIIGGENDADPLKDMSVIVARYGVEGQSGLLGVIGPTRMQYSRAIAVVRYMTQTLNDLLADTYGS